MTTFDHLRQLPPPQIFEELSYERIRDGRISDIRSRVPDWNPLETDAVYILIESFSAYVYLLRQYFNVRQISQLLAFATVRTWIT